MTFIPVISVTPYLYAWYLWREFAFSAKTLYVYRELHWYLYFEYYVFTHLTYAKKERNGILIASHDLFGFFYFFISSVFFRFVCWASFFLLLFLLLLLCYAIWVGIGFVFIIWSLLICCGLRIRGSGIDTMHVWEFGFSFTKCCYVHNFDRFFLSFCFIICIFICDQIDNKEMLSILKLEAHSAESHHEKAIVTMTVFFSLCLSRQPLPLFFLFCECIFVLCPSFFSRGIRHIRHMLQWKSRCTV